MNLNLWHKISVLAICLSSTFFAELAGAAPFSFDEDNGTQVKGPLGSYRVLAICLPEHATIKSKQADPIYTSLDWEGFEERDLTIVEMRNHSAHLVKRPHIGTSVLRNKTGHSERFRVGSRRKGLSETAQCENKLEFVLIGKDQTVKQRWDNFPSTDILYSIIDAMPMRRFEMRQRREKN